MGTATSGDDDEDDIDEDNDDDEDDDGQIDLKELKAFRDKDRKLDGKGVPEFIHKTDERFAGLSPEQRNLPDTIKRGGYQETADDEDDAMALEAGKDGEGKIDYDEFVAVIC